MTIAITTSSDPPTCKYSSAYAEKIDCLVIAHRVRMMSLEAASVVWAGRNAIPCVEIATEERNRQNLFPTIAV